MAKLSKTQQELVDKMAAEGITELVRRPGGYWTGEHTKELKKTCQQWEWHFGTLTVRALIKKGVLIPTKTFDNGKPWWVVLNEDVTG